MRMKGTSKGLKRKALSELQPAAAVRKEVDGCPFKVSRMRNRIDAPAVLQIKPADHENSAPPTDENGLAEYWRELAEERRVALEETLEENKQLHEKLELLTAENKHLQTIADQAFPLADLLKEFAREVEHSQQH